MRRIHKTFLITFLVTILYWGYSLKFGFSQDDFFHFTIARASSFKDFLLFFKPSTDWIFYRPISTQVTYWIANTFFDIEKAHIPLRVGMITLHALNATLFAHLVSKITKKRNQENLLIITAILYSIAVPHFLSIYYVGAIQELLTMFFSLIVILYSLRGRRSYSIFFYILALLSKELALRIPFITTGIFYIKNKNLKVAWNKTKHLYLVAILYATFRYLTQVNIPTEYAVTFLPSKILANIMWYSLFTLGAPENLLNYGLSQGSIDFTRFISDHGFKGIINIIAIVTSAGILIRSAFLRIRKGKLNQLLEEVGIWIAGILPVLTLATHRFAHYLDLSMVGLFLAINRGVGRRVRPFLIFALVAGYISGYLIELPNHWTTGRAQIVQKITRLMQESGSCRQSKIIFQGKEEVLKEVKYAILYDHGPRILCKNPDLEVEYTSSIAENGELVVIELNEEILP